MFVLLLPSLALSSTPVLTVVCFGGGRPLASCRYLELRDQPSCFEMLSLDDILITNERTVQQIKRRVKYLQLDSIPRKRDGSDSDSSSSSSSDGDSDDDSDGEGGKKKKKKKKAVNAVDAALVNAIKEVELLILPTHEKNAANKCRADAEAAALEAGEPAAIAAAKGLRAMVGRSTSVGVRQSAMDRLEVARRLAGFLAKHLEQCASFRAPAAGGLGGGGGDDDDDVVDGGSAEGGAGFADYAVVPVVEDHFKLLRDHRLGTLLRALQLRPPGRGELVRAGGRQRANERTNERKQDGSLLSSFVFSGVWIRSVC